MVNKEEAKRIIKGIVEEFSKIPKEQLDKKSEEQIKFQFIEPLFKTLGWETSDFEKEQRILKGRADYILKSGNKELLVIEAKKTSSSLTEDDARQTISYAYHQLIKFAVLTNFKEIRVYHALSNIRNANLNLLKVEKSYFVITYDDFEKRFDHLWLLSKESFEKGEINKLLSAKDEKLLKPIDENILEDLLHIRGLLSTNLKKYRMHLTPNQLDEAVQMLIDRLIFMRAVEDRGLEEKGMLKKIVKNSEQGLTTKVIWATLIEEFKRFDSKYNSKLFFEGLLEKDCFFDNSTLAKVIKSLYYGFENKQEQYEFDKIPGDLLGSIYEQYLGTILSGTEKRVKLENGSGKRKKMGIYYTPTYIVDYIVKNTVREYIKDKPIDEILKVRIVDPACGSGSFLTRAFQEVCDVVREKLNDGDEGSKILFKSTKEKIDDLNLGQKIEILRNCIYGVDLDEKAVELARLNLMLRALENQKPGAAISKLPELVNIRCGNSLIDDNKISDKAFNWKAQFPEVFKDGGFDIVIGNPPYIRIQTLAKEDVEYFNKKYESSEMNYDIYILFIEMGHGLLKTNGLLGFILPNKFFSANYGKNTRNFLIKTKSLKKIVDFKDFQIFESATTYTCLLFLSKSNNERVIYCSPCDESRLRSGIINNDSLKCFSTEIRSDSTWNFSDESSIEIDKKLERISLKLQDVTERIFQGIRTSSDSVYVLDIKENKNKTIIGISKSLNKTIEIESNIVHPLIKGKEMRRYYIGAPTKIIIVPYIIGEKNSLIEKDILERKFPLCWSYFKLNKPTLENREEGKMRNNNWYGFVYPKNLDIMNSPKIVTTDIVSKNSFSIDNDGKLFFTSGYGIIPKNINIKALLGILNSKLIETFLKKRSTHFRGGFYSCESRFIKSIPICLPTPTQEKKIVELVNQMIEFQKKYHDPKISGNERDKLKQQITNVDYDIDQEVYKLYGITNEEKKIIEESLKS